MIRFRRGLRLVRGTTYLPNQDGLNTSQSINGPLLKLLQFYLCCRRVLVKIKTMPVFLVLVGWIFELLLVVDCDLPLGISAIIFLPYHLDRSLILYPGRLESSRHALS